MFINDVSSTGTVSESVGPVSGLVVGTETREESVKCQSVCDPGISLVIGDDF